MKNQSKIIIGIIVVAALVYAALAFDLPYSDRDDSGDVGTARDLIRITVPAANDSIGSPATFSGEARGTWFFEATFPIDVRALDGTVLGRGYAEATSDWMTENFVPWVATISFDPKGNTEGVVRFMKDNPSGLPENDAYVDVPVKFKIADGNGTGATGGIVPAQCRPTGCSGQICSDEDVVSNCMYKPEYACYRTAKCERQADSKCGWTETPALTACLLNPPQE